MVADDCVGSDSDQTEEHDKKPAFPVGFGSRTAEVGAEPEKDQKQDHVRCHARKGKQVWNMGNVTYKIQQQKCLGNEPCGMLPFPELHAEEEQYDRGGTLDHPVHFCGN